MPSTSKKQHNFMAAVANNPAFAKKVGIKQSVGEDFMKADKGRKFGSGGMPHSEKGEMKADVKQDKAMIKKAVGMHDKQLHGGKKTNLASLKKGGVAKYAKGGFVAPSKMGAVKTAAPSRDGVAVKGKTKGKQIVMAGNKRMNKGGRAC